MAALLLRAQLVFEVHAGSAGGDHRLHQLEDVERAAEAGFGIGDDRQIPVLASPPFERFDLVEARQRVVEPRDHGRNAVGRIKALVGIHLTGQIGVGGDLPAAAVQRAKTGPRRLDRLISA